MNLIILILLIKLFTLQTVMTEVLGESFEDRRAKTQSNSYSIALPPTDPCRHICYSKSFSTIYQLF